MNCSVGKCHVPVDEWIHWLKNQSVCHEFFSPPGTMEGFKEGDGVVETVVGIDVTDKGTFVIISSIEPKGKMPPLNRFRLTVNDKVVVDSLVENDNPYVILNSPSRKLIGIPFEAFMECCIRADMCPHSKVLEAIRGKDSAQMLEEISRFIKPRAISEGFKETLRKQQEESFWDEDDEDDEDEDDGEVDPLEDNYFFTVRAEKVEGSEKKKKIADKWYVDARLSENDYLCCRLERPDISKIFSLDELRSLQFYSFESALDEAVLAFESSFNKDKE